MSREPGRSVLLVMAGFAVGLAVMSFYRRQGPQPPPISPARNEQTPTQEKEPSGYEAPAPPTERSADLNEKKPAPIPSTSEGRVVVPDTSRTRFGRPPKPKTADLVKLGAWEDFYRACRERGIRGELLEDLILRRLAQELGVKEEQADALKDLFKAEQVASTKAIVEAAGGWSNFEKQNEDKGPGAVVRYEEWRRLRSAIRDSFAAEYLKILVTHDRLKQFSEHLRNDALEVSNSYSSEGDYHLIGGVGR